MRDKERHLREEELIEYFYNESSLPEEIEGHLNGCPHCNQRYLRLQREMAALSENYKKAFWTRQRHKVMSEVGKGRRAKKAVWSHAWLRPAFAAALILLLIFGVYSHVHRTPVRYTQKDIEEEAILDRVSELANQPLTSALDDFAFQVEEYPLDEEDALEDEYTYPSEKLDIFGLWPELDA